MSSIALTDIKSFYTTASTTGDCTRSIPRNFFQTYKTSLFDQQHAEWMRLFRVQHPDHNFIFHDDQAMDEFMKTHWGHHPIYPIYLGAQFGPSKADIWRYCILYTYGGIYLDIDSAILFKLNIIPTEMEEMISYEKNQLETFSWQTGWPCGKYFASRNFHQPKLSHSGNIALQWLLIFKAEHPIMGRVIELIVEYSSFYKNKEFDNVLHAVTSFTGPLVYTQALWEHVEQGNHVSEFGFDFNGRAVFKNIPDPPNSIYLSNPNHYELQRNKIVLSL